MVEGKKLMPSSRLLNSGSIIAAVAAIALGAGAWFYHQQSIELRQSRQALDQAKQKAQEQEQSLNDAVKNSQQYQEEQKVRSRRISLLTNGLNAASSVKVAMAEHYMAYLKWPVSNQDAGVSTPESFKTDGVTSIAVQPNGKIRLILMSSDGKPEQLWLTGSINKAMQVSWKCSTEDIPDVAQLIPACSYSGK